MATANAQESRGIVQRVVDDVTCLKSMWFAKGGGDNHAERLDSFYKPQAEQYDKFRDRFLWGRRPMLATVAAKLPKATGNVWVDLGGGTGENVLMMAQYTDLSRFKAIYVVDLCKSLCDVARKKFLQPEFRNVHVIEADACTFSPEKIHIPADLITYSYSLSMIPPFHDTIDQAFTYLADEGLVGVADFYVSGKWDLPLRQMPWSRRFFWRSIFDIDGIDLGPERRTYLDHKLDRIWEVNSEGAIPYVPYLRAPWYVWIGKKPTGGVVHHEAHAEAPALFPPTFLYTQSWEDPEPDMKVFNLNDKDVCLTLTSGGCNALNMVVHGAKQVVGVDCNPAQSALLELKQIAIRKLEYEDVWLMFGEGKHPNFKHLFLTQLGPDMTEKSYKFWATRQHYFDTGLYWQGGMGKLCHVLHYMCMFTGLTSTKAAICNAKDLEEQKRVWNSLWLVQFLKSGSGFIVDLFIWLASLIFLNKLVLWYGGGVPAKQFELIQNDKVPIGQYIARTFDGVAQNSHLRTRNYFYYNCLMGRFIKENCPSYLKPDNFRMLKENESKLEVITGTFMEALMSRKFTKVILMDHVDWLEEAATIELAKALKAQVLTGGKVIWRSASNSPPYAKHIAAHGFDVTRLQVATEGFMDRVNMYSSFYVAVRKA